MFKFYRVSNFSNLAEKVFEDGSYQEVSITSPEVVAWLAEGNELEDTLAKISKEEDEARLQALLGSNYVPPPQ